MNIGELAGLCGWKLIAGKGGISRPVDSCYIGDLLSWVMGRAHENNLWLTVMGNVNAVAVAVLADVSGIVLTESAVLDDEAKARAEIENIPVFTTDKNTYETAIDVYHKLNP